jgi:hypothetical protein
MVEHLLEHLPDSGRGWKCLKQEWWRLKRVRWLASWRSLEASSLVGWEGVVVKLVVIVLVEELEPVDGMELEMRLLVKAWEVKLQGKDRQVSVTRAGRQYCSH